MKMKISPGNVLNWADKSLGSVEIIRSAGLKKSGIFLCLKTVEFFFFGRSFIMLTSSSK